MPDELVGLLQCWEVEWRRVGGIAEVRYRPCTALASVGAGMLLLLLLLL